MHYRANIMTIHEAGHVVSTPMMVDTLDTAEIEVWIRKSDETKARLKASCQRPG